MKVVGECAGYCNEDTINNVGERGLHSEPHHDTRFPSSTPAAPQGTDCEDGYHGYS